MVIGLAAIAASTAIHQVIEGATLGMVIFGAIKYRKIPRITLRNK